MTFDGVRTPFFPTRAPYSAIQNAAHWVMAAEACDSEKVWKTGQPNVAYACVGIANGNFDYPQIKA